MIKLDNDWAIIDNEDYKDKFTNLTIKHIKCLSDKNKIEGHVWSLTVALSIGKKPESFKCISCKTLFPIELIDKIKFIYNII